MTQQAVQVECNSAGYAYSTQKKAGRNEDVVSEYQKIVAKKIEELSEKLQNGEAETSYQIGAQSFTEQEWNKLMDEYDYMQDEVKKMMRERHEEQTAKSQKIKEEKEKQYKDEITDMQIEKLLEDRTEVEAVGKMTTYMEYKVLLEKLETHGKIKENETKVTKVIFKQLRPVDNWVEIVKCPLPLASYSKVDVENNSVNIAEGTRIAIHDGYILTVNSDWVEVSKIGKPSEAYQSYAMAHSMAQTLEILLRNSGGMICDVAKDKGTWEYALVFYNNLS